MLIQPLEMIIGGKQSFLLCVHAVAQTYFFIVIMRPLEQGG